MFSNDQIPFEVQWFASDETELFCITCDTEEMDYYVTVLDFLSAPSISPVEMETRNESLFKCPEPVRRWAIASEIKKIISK